VGGGWNLEKGTSRISKESYDSVIYLVTTVIHHITAIIYQIMTAIYQITTEIYQITTVNQLITTLNQLITTVINLITTVTNLIKAVIPTPIRSTPARAPLATRSSSTTSNNRSAAKVQMIPKIWNKIYIISFLSKYVKICQIFLNLAFSLGFRFFLQGGIRASRKKISLFWFLMILKDKIRVKLG
jgi:hypothetical protein